MLEKPARLRRTRPPSWSSFDLRAGDDDVFSMLYRWGTCSKSGSGRDPQLVADYGNRSPCIPHRGACVSAASLRQPFRGSGTEFPVSIKQKRRPEARPATCERRRSAYPALPVRRTETGLHCRRAVGRTASRETIVDNGRNEFHLSLQQHGVMRAGWRGPLVSSTRRGRVRVGHSVGRRATGHPGALTPPGPWGRNPAGL